MATITLYPGTVDTFQYTDDPGSFTPCTIVGTTPQWADSNDATYAIGDSPIAEIDQNSPIAPLDPLPPAVAINYVDVFVRYSTTSPTPTSRGFFIELWRTDSRATTDTHIMRTGAGTVGFPTAPDDNSIHEFTYRLLPASWMSDEDEAAAAPALLDGLQDGATINFWSLQSPPGAVTTTTTIYETRLIVGYDPRGVYPLRRYPPVNNGGSGPTRHYPRAVNRRAGGTY